MAHGRDAVDVALTTSFGATRLDKFAVWTDGVTERELDEVPERRTSVEWNATTQV
jgi:hypothetical protein